MGLTRLLLMITGFGLMGFGGALLTCDIYLADQLRKLVRGEQPNRKKNPAIIRDFVWMGMRTDRNGIRRQKPLRVARYASLEGGNLWRKATGASLPDPKASTAALERLGREKAEAFGSHGFPPRQRRLSCHPASGT